MNNSKNKILLYLCIAIFGMFGVYLTFIASNISNYDSQTKAYKIDPNESYDSDDGTTYHPIYYYKVNGKDYQCNVNVGSSSYPNKKIVYYDSSDPTKCKTEYETKTNKTVGIIFLIVTAITAYFFIIKKPSNNIEIINQTEETSIVNPYQLSQEKVEKIIQIVDRVQLIIKRVILGIIIIILSVFVLVETFVLKQTIEARNYIETTAVFVDRKNNPEDSIFDECIYKFKDKQGNEQEIIIGKDKDTTAKNKIIVKYNEKNPKEYYQEDSILDKTEIIWYIVKIVLLVLLIILFFNKKLLSKINISLSSRN